MTTLIDTSAWSLAIRRNPEHLSPGQQNVVQEIEDLIALGQTRIIGPIRQELLSGIGIAEEYERLRARLRIFSDEPLSTEDYEQAAVVSNRCRQVGIAESHIDSLICAAALRRDWTVLTTDLDFARYADVVSIRVELRGV